MSNQPPEWILPVGAQVVVLSDVLSQNGRIAHPKGAVGTIVRSPADQKHSYRVRFTDGVEAPLSHSEIVLLSDYKAGRISGSSEQLARHGLFDRVILRVVIGSRAYGLETEQSDVDRRGIYLPPASLHWSLYGVPEQLECDATQEVYWELQKFIVLALKANPNVLECLYSPIVETVTPLAQELIALRERFLSRLVYQTYSGYVLSQFRKMQADLRNQGRIKWKHVMHLIRLLYSAITVLKEGHVPVKVESNRDLLLSIRSGSQSFEDVELLRQKLHEELDLAYASTNLPERPDYDVANDLLLKARRLAIEEPLP